MSERPQTDWRAQKWLGVVPGFDPAAGWVVRQPPGDGVGYWPGAPSAI